MLHDVFDSGDNLERRFGASPSIDEALRIFNEEVFELINAVVRQDEYTYCGGDTGDTVMEYEYISDVHEEAADVLYTLLGVLRAVEKYYAKWHGANPELNDGVTVAKFTGALHRILDKNNAKTHETHELVGGKIRRKGKK